MNIYKILIGPMLFLIWLCVNTVYLIRQIKRAVIKANSDIPIVVKCEKCQNQHNATIDEFLQNTLSKTKSIDISANVGPIGFSGTHHKYFAKKFYCPVCKKKTWSQVINYNNLSLKNTNLMFPFILKYFASLLLGGAVIMLITKILF